MATKEKVQAFIEELAAIARNEYLNRDRWVLPSVAIAQSALETGWGTAGIMVKAHAYFGIKAGSSWTGKVYSSKTKECYDGVNYTSITDVFRAYDDVADSVKDYYDLIAGLTRYAGAVNNPDPLSTITAIKNAGYATSPTYITNVMSIINTYNLTQYDKWVGENQASANEVSADIAAGDIVEVIDNTTYNGVKFKLYYNQYEVIQVNGDRAVIGIGSTITAAVKLSSIKKIGAASAEVEDAIETNVTEVSGEVETTFKAGGKCEVVNACDYYGNSFKCWYNKYDIIEVSGDRVVIGIGKTVTAAINAANIVAA